MVRLERTKTMIRRISSFPALALLLFLLPTATAAAEEAVIDLGEPGVLVLPLPKDWSHDVSPAGADKPPTAELRAANSDTIVLVTPFWAHDGAEPDYGTADSVRRVVERSAAEIAPGAADRELKILPIGADRIGFMFFATDKSLVGRAPPPGEYKYLLQGAVMVGKLLCTFTYLTNDKSSANIGRTLEVMLNATHRTGA